MNDTKPFRHGEEGSHYACPEMVQKLGGEVGCCGCNQHVCKQNEPESNICPHCHTPIKIRNQSGYCDHLRYPEGCEVCSGQPMPKQQDSKWREETTVLAIEMAGMVIEGIVSNKKKQTFHVSRIAGKLQKIIDKKVAAERKRSIKLFAEHLLTLKDGTHDVRAEARRFIRSIEKLTKQAGTGKMWNEIRLRHGRADDIVLDDGDMHLEICGVMSGGLDFTGAKNEQAFSSVPRPR